jgi:methyl-accepting chemotaxis protein
MSLMDKYSIKQRLFFFFGVGTVIFLGFAAYAIVKLNAVGQQASKLYEHPMQVSTSALSASENVAKMQRGMKDLMLVHTEEERGKLLRLVDEFETRVIANLDVIKNQIIGGEGQLLEERTRIAFLTWKPLRDEVIAKVTTGDLSAAGQITRTTGKRHVEDLEAKFSVLKEYAFTKASTFITTSEEIQSQTMYWVIGSVVLVSLLFLVIARMASRSIVDPLLDVQELVKKLSEGKLPESSRQRGVDEISQMHGALDNFVGSLRNTAKFASQVGDGNFDEQFEALGTEDVLGSALIEMRDKLKAVATEEEQRNWTTNGLADFGELLRKHQDNLDELSSHLVSQIVTYLQAGIGAIFITREDDQKLPILKLAACYAWDRNKFLEREVKPGQGLVGQCYLEKETLFMTEIPPNYLNIVSGSGNAVPRSAMVVPLIDNGEVFGVLELASIHVFLPYEVAFVELVGGSIAATISASLGNQRTKRLLDESTESVQQIAAQEEELRQNAEELQAIQEEMQRTVKSQEKKIEGLEIELVKLRGEK